MRATDHFEPGRRPSFKANAAFDVRQSIRRHIAGTPLLVVRLSIRHWGAAVKRRRESMQMEGRPVTRSGKERARIKQLLAGDRRSVSADARPVPWPKANAHPVDFLEAWMVNSGRTQNDLAKLIGSRSIASLILNRRRTMSLDVIRALVFKWRLPAEPLLVPYKTGKTKKVEGKRPAKRKPTPRRGGSG